MLLDDHRWRTSCSNNCCRSEGVERRKGEIFVQPLGRSREIKGHETNRRKMMRRQSKLRMHFAIKSPPIEELVLRLHRRRNVIRVEVICSNYPGAEN